jgi:hypothetical protein
MPSKRKCVPIGDVPLRESQRALFGYSHLSSRREKGVVPRALVYSSGTLLMAALIVPCASAMTRNVVAS